MNKYYVCTKCYSLLREEDAKDYDFYCESCDQDYLEVEFSQLKNVRLFEEGVVLVRRPIDVKVWEGVPEESCINAALELVDIYEEDLVELTSVNGKWRVVAIGDRLSDTVINDLQVSVDDIQIVNS